MKKVFTILALVAFAATSVVSMSSCKKKLKDGCTCTATDPETGETQTISTNDAGELLQLLDQDMSCKDFENAMNANMEGELYLSGCK
jgi:hypothetical protein